MATSARAAQAYPDITLIVGFGPGQGIDQPVRPQPGGIANLRLSPDAAYVQTARFLAAHLGRFLPGEPVIAVRNMPGAGGLVAARYLLDRAPTDGSVIAMAGAAPFFAALTPGEEALTHLRYVGSRMRETFLCVAWHKSILRRLEDARTAAVFAGSLGANSRGQAQLVALNELLGARFHIVAGYANTFELSRSLENGEIEVACGYTFSLLQSRHGDWLREGRVVPLTRFGDAPFAWRTPVPLASEEPANEIDRQALRLLDVEGDLVWSIVAPPGQSNDWIVTLRAAFEAMMADPQVLQAAAQHGVQIEPIGGEDLQALVERTRAIPAAALERAKLFLEAK